MIVMGNDSPYRVQQLIKNWEQTHEIPKNTKGSAEGTGPAVEEQLAEEVRRSIHEMVPEAD